MHIKAVFLDIDNTLLSFDEYLRQTMSQGFAHFGLKPYEPYMFDVFNRENDALWRQIEQGTLTFSELIQVRWNRVFHALGIDFDGPTFEQYFRAALNESAIPEPGAPELLRALHGKYLLCAASNGPYTQQVHRLDIAGMLPYFDALYISERIGASKPSRAFFEAAFASLNHDRQAPIQPNETLMLGDSLTSDMAGGTQYGMKTCYYRRGSTASVPEGIDLVIDRLEQLPALLEKKPSEKEE